MGRHDAAAAKSQAKLAKAGAKAPQQAVTGRRGPSMTRYLGEMRWEKNRQRRIRRHILAHPRDMLAWHALGDGEPGLVQFMLGFGAGDLRHFPKKMRTPRGDARRRRRAATNWSQVRAERERRAEETRRAAARAAEEQTKLLEEAK